MNKESRPEQPGFELPPEGVLWSFLEARVCRSNGVMIFQVESQVLPFVNAPILQYSKTAPFLPAKPLKLNLVPRTRFSMNE